MAIDALDRGLRVDPKDRALLGLRSALGGSDVVAIRSATDALMAAAQRLGESLYQQAAASPSDVPGGGDDDIVDAEIVDDEAA